MKNKNILSTFVIFILLTTAIASCSKSGGTSGGSVTPPPPVGVGVIGMAGMNFSPSSITIKVGETARWTNNDNVTHTVTSNDGTTFNSGNVAVGASYSFTATAAGSFPYHCSLHAGMSGILTVTN